jgi:hypothetical protein
MIKVPEMSAGPAGGALPGPEPGPEPSPGPGTRPGPGLDEAPEQAPEQTYELVVAATHPQTRKVFLQGHRLFAVGARPGDASHLTVRCLPTDEHGTVFAVVTWHDRTFELLSIGSVKLAPGLHRVRAVLDGPGRVRFSEPAGMAPDRRRWADLVAAVPARLAPPVAALDLVCAVELGGARDEVDARLTLVRELIKLLRDESPGPGGLRVAVLGYGDHVFDGVHEGKRVVKGAWLADPAEALTAVGRLRPAERHYPDAAPVEDMLAVIVPRLERRTRSADGRRPDGGEPRRAALLTVGSRGPHPAQTGESSILPCPRRLDFHRLVARLDRVPDLARIAVVDHPPRARDGAWQRLGGTALRTFPDADPRSLGVDLGVLAPHVQRLPFPLVAHEPLAADERGDR